jgi:hypothetical protein
VIIECGRKLEVTVTILRIYVLRLLATAALTATLPLPAFGLAEDFENPVPGFWWSSTTRETWTAYDTNSGELSSSTFLGPFDNETLVFSGMDLFDGPTPHVASFDLLIFGDWTGDTPGAESVFTVRSFSNVGWGVRTEVSIASFLSASTQSYPDPTGGGSHPAGTGATQNVSLLLGGLMSIYHFDLYMPANEISETCCGDVSMEFIVEGTSGTWGIDNFEATPVPEPSTGLLVGLGLTLLSNRRRGKRSPIAR